MRPLDSLQGAIVPTVRRGYASLGNGRFALGLGDVHIVNDPIGGQGANAASYAAFVVGEAIREMAAFDEGLCQMVDARRWEYLSAVTNFNNALLLPPSPAVHRYDGGSVGEPSVRRCLRQLLHGPDSGVARYIQSASVGDVGATALRCWYLGFCRKENGAVLRK
jgi:hypothetical protein